MSCTGFFEVAGLLAAGLAIIIWTASAIIFVKLAWEVWLGRKEGCCMVSKRCESLTAKGERCKRVAAVYLKTSDGIEYVACQDHDREGFRPYKPPQAPAGV